MGAISIRTAEVGPFRIRYRESGAGYPVVLVHGFPGPECWDGVVERLSARYRCIVYSPVGMGEIEGPLDGDYSMKGQGELLTGFLDALRIRRAHLVGHDTGGGVAQAVAAYAPQYIERLVLSDCDTLDNWPPLQLKLLRLLLAVSGVGPAVAASLRIPCVARSALAFGNLYDDKDRLTRDRIAELRRPFEGAERRARFRRLLQAMDPAVTMAMVEPLARFEQPTLIVWGKRNAYWRPFWASRLAATVGGTERVELLETGLTGCEEQPETFCRLLQEFFDEEAGFVAKERSSFDARSLQ